MNKELLRKAFEAGKKYGSSVQTKKSLQYKRIDFDEWYDAEITSQKKKSICDHKWSLIKHEGNYFYNCLICYANDR